VPLVPEEPDEPKYVPSAPDVPLVPDVPDVPELPLVPLVPEVPDVPDVPLVPDEPELPKNVPSAPDVPELPLVPLVPELPPVPLVPSIPDVPETPEVPELVEPPVIDVLLPIVLVELLYTKTSFELKSLEMLSNLKLPEIKTLPVNCPLNCPLSEDKFATDDDTDVNVEFKLSVVVYNVFTELETFSSIVRLASISAAVKGLPFGILLLIAMVFYLLVCNYTNKY
jgi:hypothetical protein